MADPKPNKGQYPHFMRDTYRSTVVPTQLNGLWWGIKVMWWPRDGRALIVMPTNTKSRLVILGTPFVPLPTDLRVLVPLLGRGSVGRDGAGYRDVRDQQMRRFWVSTHTADPYHILIDWEVGATMGPAGEVFSKDILATADGPEEVDTFDEQKSAIWKTKN